MMFKRKIETLANALGDVAARLPAPSSRADGPVITIGKENTMKRAIIIAKRPAAILASVFAFISMSTLMGFGILWLLILGAVLLRPTDLPPELAEVAHVFVALSPAGLILAGMTGVYMLAVPLGNLLSWCTTRWRT